MRKASIVIENEKYFLTSLRSVPRRAVLPLVIGAYNKGYMIQGSSRPSPKFFFYYVPEKLRISLALGAIGIEHPYAE